MNQINSYKATYVECIVSVSTALNYSTNKMMQDLQLTHDNAEKIQTRNEAQDNALLLYHILQNFIKALTNIQLEFQGRYKNWLDTTIDWNIDTQLLNSEQNIKNEPNLVSEPERPISSDSAVSDLSSVGDIQIKNSTIDVENDIELGDIQIVNEVSYYKIQKGNEKNREKEFSESIQETFHIENHDSTELVSTKIEIFEDFLLTNTSNTDSSIKYELETSDNIHIYNESKDDSEICSEITGDAKLNSRCYVLVEKILPEAISVANHKYNTSSDDNNNNGGDDDNDSSGDDDNDLDCVENDGDNSSDQAFKRLINLDNLEKRKRTYSTTDSVSSNNSLISKMKGSAKKIHKKSKKSSMDSFSSSSSSLSDSSDGIENDDIPILLTNNHVNNNEFDDDEWFKQNLLKSDDDSIEIDGDDNDDDDNDNVNKLPLKIKKSLQQDNSYKVFDPSDSLTNDDESDDDSNHGKKKEWMNDPLLHFTVDNSKPKNEEKLSNEEEQSDGVKENLKQKQKKTRIKLIDSDEDYTSLDTISSDGIECLGSYYEVSENSRQTDESIDVVLLEPNNSLNTSIPKKSGRRNIRDILGDEFVAADTKQAGKDEENRINRLEKRNQQLKIEEKKENLLVLDVDLKTNKNLIAVDRGLLQELKPHQKDGVKFMWDSCFETFDQAMKTKGSGCILAHCMGLGKTLQVIALVHTLLFYKNIGVQSIMVICPKNTVYNWVDEFDSWQKKTVNKVKIRVFDLTRNEKTYRLNTLKSWHEKGGVLIISYELFRILASQSNRFTPEENQQISSYLLNPGADLVVCDEGHLLKNEQSRLAEQMMYIKTKRRIVLTGTPLQNNLKEYHCMVQFVKPNLLGTKTEFANRFINPITNGQCSDSNEYDVNLMKKRSHVLYKILEGSVQRRDYAVLTPFLPPKQEYVLHIRLSNEQEKMYKYFLEEVICNTTRQKCLLKNYHTIQQLVAHPKSLEIKFKKMMKTNIKMNKKDDAENNCESDEIWWEKLIDKNTIEDYRISYKMVILFAILRRCEVEGDKLIVFSQSLHILNLIEEYLEKIDQKKINYSLNFQGRWKKGSDYNRLDGTVASKKRNEMCKLFNKPSNRRFRLFLISTKAGGLGINLTGANRVIIFDPSWNPSNDVQSIFRTFRFGQKKSCFIYRFLAVGTMEQKIYNRQVTKLSLSLRVLDEQQIERHFRDNELADLYTYEPVSDDVSIVEMPKDLVLKDVMKQYPDYICNFLEHDSLFQNKEDEKLDEEERNEAWLEYKQETDNSTNNKVILKKFGATSSESDFLKADPVLSQNIVFDEVSNSLNSDTSFERSPSSTRLTGTLNFKNLTSTASSTTVPRS